MVTEDNEGTKAEVEQYEPVGSIWERTAVDLELLRCGERILRLGHGASPILIQYLYSKGRHLVKAIATEQRTSTACHTTPQSRHQNLLVIPHLPPETWLTCRLHLRRRRDPRQPPHLHASQPSLRHSRSALRYQSRSRGRVLLYLGEHRRACRYSPGEGGTSDRAGNGCLRVVV
jgi:hypothetical protein